MDESRKPKSRAKRVVSEGRGVEKKGEGLGTGPLGNQGTYADRKAQQSGQGFQKTDGELADDLQRWLGGIRPRSVVVDPSAASFIAELRKRALSVQKADNAVLDGIRSVGTLLREGKLLFASGCERTLEEFTQYVWDSKAADRGEDKPVKEHDHAMDAVRYFVSTVLVRGRARGIRRPGNM